MKARVSKILKISVDIFLFLLVGVGILVVFSYIPIPGNYKIFTIQSGSMSPALSTGSLIFVKPMADYNVGDVITRRTDDPKASITHRITKKDAVNGKAVFKTKGDANDGEDSENVNLDSIVGKKLLSIPLLGYPVSFAKTTPGFIVLIIIPGIVIIYDELHKIKDEAKAIHTRRKERKAAAGEGKKEEKTEKTEPEQKKKSKKKKEEGNS